MKKFLTPTVVGTLVGLIVIGVFIWGYAMFTTFVGANRPVRATQEELPLKFQEYCDSELPGGGSHSLPEMPVAGTTCCLLYGFYSENGQEYPYVGLVAKQLFMNEYTIREDLMEYARSETPSSDRVWKGSGEITTDGYILFKYTAQYEIDESGASVRFERHIKLLDLISVCLLFTFADIAGRGFRKSRLKMLAENKSEKA